MLVRHGRSGQEDGRPRGFRSRGRVFMRKLLILVALTAMFCSSARANPLKTKGLSRRRRPRRRSSPPPSRRCVRAAGRRARHEQDPRGGVARRAEPRPPPRDGDACGGGWERLLSGDAGGRQDADEPRHPELLLWHAGRRSGSAAGPDHGRLQDALRAAAGGAVSAAFGSRRATRIRPSKVAPASQPGG